MKNTVYVGTVPSDVARLIVDAMEERVHALVSAKKYDEARSLLYDLKDIINNLEESECEDNADNY